MQAGEYYFGMDPVLFQERQQAKEKLVQYHKLAPNQLVEKEKALRQLFGKVGENCFIEPPFYCDYGSNIEVGNNFYANFNCTILDPARVTIGDNVLLGPNVNLFTAGHPVETQKRIEGLEYAKPITIKDNVWIGGNTVINPGVTIGENTIIGSGSVVTKDIPADVIAVGNPCKVIKQIEKE